MEMNGGSTASHLACTQFAFLRFPYFNRSGSKAAFRPPGATWDHFRLKNGTFDRSYLMSRKWVHLSFCGVLPSCMVVVVSKLDILPFKCTALGCRKGYWGSKGTNGEPGFQDSKTAKTPAKLGKTQQDYNWSCHIEQPQIGETRLDR